MHKLTPTADECASVTERRKLKAELFLPWDREGFLNAIQRNIDLLSVSEDGKTILRGKGWKRKGE